MSAHRRNLYVGTGICPSAPLSVLDMACKQTGLGWENVEGRSGAELPGTACLRGLPEMHAASIEEPGNSGQV